MKLIIKNQFGDTLELLVPSDYTIKQVLGDLYSKNINLHDHISSDMFNEAVSISLNGTKLELEKTLTDCGMDILAAEEVSVLELTAIKEIDGLDTLTLINLQLEMPEIPNDLRCPLSMLIFRNPIILPCGTAAEQGFILQWVKDKEECPFTRLPLHSQEVLQLEPDVELQKQVAEFLKQHQGNVYFKELENLQYAEEIPEISAAAAGPIEMVPLDIREFSSYFRNHGIFATNSAGMIVSYDRDQPRSLSRSFFN